MPASDSTTDGADTLRLTNLYSSTVYGASGADSFALASTIDSSRIEVGTDASFNGVLLHLTIATIIGGAAADSLTLKVKSLAVTTILQPVVTLLSSLVSLGTSSSDKATVLGGAGDDTLGSTAQYAYVSVVGGTGATASTPLMHPVMLTIPPFSAVTVTTPSILLVVQLHPALRVKLETTRSPLAETL